MSKYYFINDSELCINKAGLLNYMRENNLKELKVYEAKMIKGELFFYCEKYKALGETEESCGKICEKYEPRNGKNGRCRFNKNCYERGDEVLFKL